MNTSEECTNTDSGLAEMLINNMVEPLWMVDNHLNILACNNAFVEWVQHFIGVPLKRGDNVLYDGKNEIYACKFEACYNLALTGHNFRTVEDMLIDGQVHYTSVWFQCVKDANGAVIGVSCSARDITEHRKHLMTIEQQNDVLRDIAFIASHKIRGPLATIMGLEQLYNRANPADEENIALIDGIKKMCADMDEMIHRVVKMSNNVGV